MRILVISNNPLATNSSNGRTLLNLLLNFKDEDICNIFINGCIADIGNRNYYSISEKDLLRNKKPFLHKINSPNCCLNRNSRRTKKTPLKCLIRSLIWKNTALIKEIINISKSFSPDIILVQCGDSDFTIDLGIRLSVELNKPLFSFNSEDYIFKKWNYLSRRPNKSICFRIFFNRLIKSYDNLYKNAAGHIYLTEGLQKEYLVRYPDHCSIVIYNSSKQQPVKKYSYNGEVVYSGNLGVGRLNSLINISRIIFELTGRRVVVCSTTQDENIVKLASDCLYLDFRGSLSYNENVELLKKAKLILHIESFDNYYLLDTKNAFSTKIADSLKLGIPMFVFAPKSSFTYTYFSYYKCCFLADSLINARIILEKVLFNERLLDKMRFAGNKIGKINHDAVTNSNKFISYLEEICHDI